MEEEGEKSTKRSLIIGDWNKLLDGGGEEEEPPPVIIIKSTTTTATSPKENPISMDIDRQYLLREETKKFSDFELDDKIRRMENFFKSAALKLPDKGQKYQQSYKLFVEERESRKLRRVEKEATGCENLSQPTTSSIVGTSYAARQKTASPSAGSLSTFTSHFYVKLEEKPECKNSAFGQEPSLLRSNDCRGLKYTRKLSPKVKQKGQTSSRRQPFKCSYDLSRNGHKNISSDADQNGRVRDQFNFHNSEKQPAFFGRKKDVSQDQRSGYLRPRKGQTIVVEDEEEALAIEIPEHVDTCMKEAKIYYPSRDDPESVEICYEDIKCLDPESYLTSTIMNFYIRYLQKRSFASNSVVGNYHFFNTYFYEKLKEAVSNKGKDKENFFVKFRRWWKGVNIFQKAYVLIPIHESLHWSLVIICFPCKGDESGPIILHLDSLGLHSSRSVFENIRSYIKEEWYYLDREATGSDLPLPDKIWKKLSRRIDEKIIEVPQQKNDYDCGLFVLFFIQRFIEEAPDRLKRKDLDMFGRQWFRPEEASRLRVRIKNLLKIEFQNAKRNDLSLESSSSHHAPKE